MRKLILLLSLVMSQVSLGASKNEDVKCGLETCKKTQDLKKCLGCYDTLYCCRDHQIADWKNHRDSQFVWVGYIDGLVPICI